MLIKDTIDSIESHYGNVNGPNMIKFETLNHAFETARLLNSRVETEGDSNVRGSDDTDEILRSLLSEVLDNSIIKIWARYVSIGAFQEANLIMRRHQNVSIVNFDVDLIDVINSIPISAHLDDVIMFVKTDFLPVVRQFTFSNSTESEDSRECYNYQRIIRAVADELCHRAKQSEVSFSHPFYARQAVVLAKQLTSVDGNYHNTIEQSKNESGIEKIDIGDYKSIKDIEDLLFSLNIQVELWTKWELRASLAEVLHRGLQGITYDRLWMIDEDKIVHVIQKVMSPTFLKFQINIDEVIHQWILESIATKLIRDDICFNAEGRDDNVVACSNSMSDICRLSRLVRGAGEIKGIENYEPKIIIC